MVIKWSRKESQAFGMNMWRKTEKYQTCVRLQLLVMDLCLCIKSMLCPLWPFILFCWSHSYTAKPLVGCGIYMLPSWVSSPPFSTSLSVSFRDDRKPTETKRISTESEPTDVDQKLSASWIYCDTEMKEDVGGEQRRRRRRRSRKQHKIGLKTLNHFLVHQRKWETQTTEGSCTD